MKNMLRERRDASEMIFINFVKELKTTMLWKRYINVYECIKMHIIVVFGGHCVFQTSSYYGENYQNLLQYGNLRLTDGVNFDLKLNDKHAGRRRILQRRFSSTLDKT